MDVKEEKCAKFEDSRSYTQTEMRLNVRVDANFDGQMEIWIPILCPGVQFYMLSS